MFNFLLGRKLPLITYAKRLKHYYHKLKMNTAYFRHVDGDNQFHVTFLYVDSESGVNKQFNFSRLITENCGPFLNRVAANIEKVVLKKKRKVDASNNTLPPINVSLMCNGVKRDETFPCRDLFSSPQDYTLNIQDQVLPIQANCPWVETISLPKSIMAGFLVTPCKFESFFVDTNFCTWEWYHSNVNNGKWIACGAGEMYVSTSSDVGKYLRVVCKPRDSNGRCGPDVEAISPSVVEAGPGTLPCEARHKFTSEKLDMNGFRVVSYNILADLYADQEYSRTVLFGYCPAYALELNYRRQLLFKELLGYNSDIICLQEVDTKVFRHDLEPFLKRQEMVGIHSPKGETGEGTAIFYDSHKFQQIRNWRKILGEDIQKNSIFSDLWEKIHKKETLATRIADRTTTLQVLLLESLVKSGKLLLIANIHLYFHPDADHIRLLQGVVAAIYLENLLKELKQEYPSHEISLIWCGDFNSVPECGIFQLLVTHGHVPDNHPDWRSNVEEAVEDVSYETQLKMGSACGTPQYTNYTVEFKACLDYIFYEKDNLTVGQIVPFPAEEELSLNLGIPSIFFPSDHIALVSDLRWKK